MNNTINAYCRVCAILKPHNKLTNLQTDEEMCQKVVDRLSRFNIEMDFQDNILPKTVCFICLKSLEQAYSFITAVDQAQAYLSDFTLVQVNTVETNMCNENIIYEPPDVSKDVIDIKVEDTEDPTDVNFDNSNVSEECDNTPDPIDVNEDFSKSEEWVNEVKSNVYNDDYGINVECEEDNVQIMHTIQPSNVIVEENIVESDESVYDSNDEKNVDYTNDDESLDLSNGCRIYNGIKVMEEDFNISDTNMTITPSNVIISDDSNEPLLNLNNDCRMYNGIKVFTEDDFHINNTNMSNPSAAVNSEDYKNKQNNKTHVVPEQYIKMTWMDYIWKCSHCETIFSNIEELQKHSMQYHNSCNAYQCTECQSKRQTVNAFIKHVRKHRKYLQYSCYKCFRKFPSATYTGRHKARIHEDSDFICKGCNTTFSNDSELAEHVSKYYSQWGKKSPVNHDSLTCSICHNTYANADYLHNHSYTHKDKKREYVCDICGKCYLTKSVLRNHILTHNIEQILHQCEICKSTFKTRHSLQSHSKIHSGIKPFICDICGKCFLQKNNLKNHLLSHTDNLPLTCRVCYKKFRAACNLKNHMFQHTGEKPFACDICSRDFTNRSNRNKHMRRRHGIEMVKKRMLPVGEPNLATEEVKSAVKINERKKKIIQQANRGRSKINKNIRKVKEKKQ